jgi:hypothetical protein
MELGIADAGKRKDIRREDTEKKHWPRAFSLPGRILSLTGIAITEIGIEGGGWCLF